MDPIIADAEHLANYVVEENKFTRDGVNFRAMLPGGDGERSVFRIDGLTPEFVAHYGQAFVGNVRDRKVLGWAQLTAAAARNVLPLVLVSDEPPPRHAVIKGWPDALEQRRALAMALASKADAIRWPPPT